MNPVVAMSRAGRYANAEAVNRASLLSVLRARELQLTDSAEPVNPNYAEESATNTVVEGSNEPPVNRPYPSPTEVTHHPKADLFPMMPEAEFQELKESIRQNGLREPIEIDELYRTTDGRNRLRAIRELGWSGRKLEGVFKWVSEVHVFQEPDSPSEDEITRVIVDKNILRRHLSPEQRASLLYELRAAAYETKAAAAHLEGRSKGGSHIRTKGSGETVDESIAEPLPDESQSMSVADQLAREANVSKSTSQRVIKRAKAEKAAAKKRDEPTANKARVVPNRSTIIAKWGYFLLKFHEIDRPEVKRVIFDHLGAEQGQAAEISS